MVKFLATISAIKPQMKFQKLRKFGMKIQKIGIFANQMWLKLSHHVSKKIYKAEKHVVQHNVVVRKQQHVTMKE